MQPAKYSAEWIEAMVRERNAKRLPHHECGICGFCTHYRFDGGEVYYDPSCGCCEGEGPQLTCFGNIAEWLAMQKSDEVRDRIIERMS